MQLESSPVNTPPTQPNVTPETQAFQEALRQEREQTQVLQEAIRQQTITVSLKVNAAVQNPNRRHEVRLDLHEGGALSKPTAEAKTTHEAAVNALLEKVHQKVGMVLTLEQTHITPNPQDHQDIVAEVTFRKPNGETVTGRVRGYNPLTGIANATLRAMYMILLEQQAQKNS